MIRFPQRRLAAASLAWLATGDHAGAGPLAQPPGAPFVAAVPEPATIALLAVALLAIVAILRFTRSRHRRQNRKHQRPTPPV